MNTQLLQEITLNYEESDVLHDLVEKEWKKELEENDEETKYMETLLDLKQELEEIRNFLNEKK